MAWNLTPDFAMRITSSPSSVSPEMMPSMMISLPPGETLASPLPIRRSWSWFLRICTVPDWIEAASSRTD